MFLGIVMGSAVSITVALSLTLIVFLFLPEYAGRIAEEFPPLLQALGGAAVIAVVAAASFYGELRERRWRRLAQGLLAVMLGALVWAYWPVD
jgi:Na+/citrate or Na+/malate symporter